GGRGLQERKCRLAVSTDRIELDRALDQNVQKSRSLSLMGKHHPMGKPLQVSGRDQGLEVCILHAAEEWQGMHELCVGNSHDRLSTSPRHRLTIINSRTDTT